MIMSIGRVGGPAGGPTRHRGALCVALPPPRRRSSVRADERSSGLSLAQARRARLPARRQYSVAASVCASAQAARARGVARIALPGVRCGICSCCVRVAPCAGSVAPDVAWCSGRLCELWCKRHGWRCGLLVQACRELGSLSCAVAEGASPVARAGNAQKTAMSRAKNQAKADSSKQGVEPQRERCVPSPTQRCARGAGDGFLLYALDAGARAVNRQPAEAERGCAHAEGVFFLSPAPVALRPVRLGLPAVRLRRLSASCGFAEAVCACRPAVQDLPSAVHLYIVRGEAEGTQRQQAPEGRVRGLLPGFREEVRRHPAWQARGRGCGCVCVLCLLRGECECIAQLSTESGRAHCTAARLRCVSPPKQVGTSKARQGRMFPKHVRQPGSTPREAPTWHPPSQRGWPPRPWPVWHGA